MVMFKFVVGLNITGCENKEIVEIDGEELEGLSKEERFNYINSYYNEWRDDLLMDNSYWKEIE